MKSFLKKILNRFTLIVYEFQKDRDPKEEMFLGRWSKNGMELENVGETERQMSGRLKRWPVFVVFTGYGVIRKEYTEKTELIEKVTQEKDFFWEKDGEEDTGGLVFVRLEMVQPLLEKLEKQEVALVAVSLSINVHPAFFRRWIEQNYRVWNTQTKWFKKGNTDQIFAVLLTRRLQFPVLVMVFVLLAGNYSLHCSFQEQYSQQQAKLADWQRQEEVRRAGNDKTQKIVQAFLSRKKLSLILDRIAGLVPAGITLDLLMVNPPVKPVALGETLQLRENCVIVEGHTGQPDDVAAFTEKLSEVEPLWQVMLIRLERRPDTADFVFRIEVGL